MQIAATKLAAFRSWRVAMRRKSFRQPRFAQSLRDHALEGVSVPVEHGREAIFQTRFAFGGMFGMVPRSSTCRRIASESYPLSACRISHGGNQFSNPDPAVKSATWPPASRKATGGSIRASGRGFWSCARLANDRSPDFSPPFFTRSGAMSLHRRGVDQNRDGRPAIPRQRR
jgi:hypothetical protein